MRAVGRSGRPIGAVSEANSREIKKWCSKREKVRTIFGKRLKTCRLGRAFWCVHPYGQFRRVCSRSGFPEAPICEKEPTL